MCFVKTHAFYRGSSIVVWAARTRTTRTTRTHRRGEGQGQRIKKHSMGGTQKRSGDESNGWGAKEEHEAVLVVFFLLPCLIHARYTQG